MVLALEGVLFLQFGWGNQMNAIVYGGLARGQLTRIPDASPVDGRSADRRTANDAGLDSGASGDAGKVPGETAAAPDSADMAGDAAALKQRLALLTRQLADEVARLPAEGQGAVASGAPTPEALRGQLRREIKARRLRERMLPDGLFADPAWDILLDLTLARLEGRQTPVSSLCIAAAVPTTTALRWIKTLLDRGLIERRPDPDDRRRHYIHVSDSAFAMMMQLMGRRSEQESRAG
jgi:hypothetical protein